MMNSVSVLIPVYNAEKYIKKCIDSILPQLREDDEIIILNDGSTDMSWSICKNYINVRNVTLFNEPNRGLLQARKFLVKHAKKEYLIFCDADDFWEKDAFNKINAISLDVEPDIIFFNYYFFSQNQRQPFKRITNNVLLLEDNLEKLWQKVLCSNDFNSVWSCFVKRSILDYSSIENHINLSYGEDKIQIIQVFLKKATSVYLSDIFLYNYRIDNESMTRTFNPHYFNDTVEVLKLAKQVLKEKNIYEKNAQSFSYMVLSLFEDFLVAAFSSDLEQTQIYAILTCALKENIVIDSIVNLENYTIDLTKKIELVLIKKRLFKLMFILYKFKHIVRTSEERK